MTLTKRFACAAVVAVTSLFTSLTGAASAHADPTITLTFVRSAESTSNGPALSTRQFQGPA